MTITGKDTCESERIVLQNGNGAREENSVKRGKLSEIVEKTFYEG